MSKKTNSGKSAIVTVSSEIANSDNTKNSLSAPHRKSSTFTQCPTIDLQFQHNQSMINRLMAENVNLKHEQNIVSEQTKHVQAMQLIASDAWAALGASNMLNVKYDDITRGMSAMMNELTSCLPDRQTIHVTRHNNNNRVSVRSKDSYETVISLILQHNGNVPKDIINTLSEGDIQRYSKIVPFYHTLQTGNGRGKFAQAYRKYQGELTVDLLAQMKPGKGLDIGNKDQYGQTVLDTADASSIGIMQQAMKFVK
jgi:hypothetical protein